ncbi:MAG TPA: DUF1786 domain-containing protein [Ktedonobacterales bacterium]|nr:DUF1786 domain-containing protein [Ktedonobacterales bacterium]
MSNALRILAVDVGTGTQDILLFESDKTIENCFQLIMPSPTVIMADRIKRASAEGRALVLTGRTMGGGPCGWAARDHALAGFPVFATADAARTFDDDLAMVEKMGVKIVNEPTAASLAERPASVHLDLKDFDAAAIVAALRVFDVDPAVDALAVAVFDHGAAPPGVSDRLFRFNYIAETVQRRPLPAAFAYQRETLPPDLTRLQAVAQSAAAYQRYANASDEAAQQPLPLLLMDTGSAAVLGTLDDPNVEREQESVLVNIGNFHTLAFHLLDGQIAGLFEHHTGELTQARLEELLRKLAAGTLTNSEVFDDSGHGALVLGNHHSSAFPFLAVTGPRREMLRGSALRPYEAVPHGAMMLAGCFGLLRAFADQRPDLAARINAALNN